VGPDREVLYNNPQFFDIWDIPSEVRQTKSDAVLLDSVLEKLA
jgi:hypothetical protein